ncbi:hypothetical protein J7643_09280 [bacterium]|nr:hypothetical protein [bacterium]
MESQSPELEQLFRTISLATVVMAVVWLGLFLTDPPSVLGPASFAQPRPEARVLDAYDTSERAETFRAMVKDLN